MGRAAACLFVVQSALSRQVRELEREVGAPLFHRTPRGVRLTEVGEAFLPLARRTLEAADEALRTARASARGQVGSLRVAPPEVGPWTRQVARGLEHFRRARPDIRVELVALPWAEHVEALRSRRIDVGFSVAGAGGEDPPGVASHELAKERLGTALLPADHPLARRRSLSPGDLTDLPMVLSDRAAIGSLHDVILEAVRGDGGDVGNPPVVPAPGSFAAVAQLVAGGAGWAAVADLVRQAPPPGTVARRLRGPGAVLRLRMLHREGDVPGGMETLALTLRRTASASGAPDGEGAR
jgi:DNA-binding transcriptional LysR family regulator